MSSAAPPTNAATNSASTTAPVATTHCPTNPNAARRRSSFVPATQVSSQLLAGLAAQDFHRRTLLHNNNHDSNSSGFVVTHQGQTASHFHGSLIPTTTTAFAPTTSVQVIAAAPAPPTTTMTTVATASPSASSASLSASSKLAALTEAAAAGLPLPLPPLQNGLPNNHQGQKNKGHNNNASSSLPSSSGIQFLLDAANQLKPLAQQYHHHAPMDHHNHALAHRVDDDKDDDDDDEPAVVLVPKPKKKRKTPNNNKGTTTISKLKRSKVEPHTKTTLLNDFTETTSRRPTPARSVTEDHVLTEGPPDNNHDTNGAATDDDALANQKYFATKDVVENTIGSFFWVGRGGYGITHPGNMQVRSVIQQKAIEYASLRRNQRGHVALDVLQHELRHVKFVAPRETLLAQLDADDEKERLGQVFVRKLSKKRRECLVQVHGSLEELRSYPDDVCVLVGESWVLDIINHQLREEAEALRKKGPTTAATGGDNDKGPEAEAAIQKTKSSKKRASSTASSNNGNNSSSSSKKRKTMELPPKPTLPAAPAAAAAAGLLLF